MIGSAGSKRVRPVVRCRRSGLTVVEVMLVLSILGLLLALLLPAVQSAREAARRISCQNNLHQISVASLAFEASHRFLPSNGWAFNWVADPERGYGRNQPGGWAYHIAPHLEVRFPTPSDAYLGTSEQVRTLLAQTFVATFRCPSRPAPNFAPTNPWSNPVNALFVSTSPRTDYAICEGDYITDTRRGPNSLEEGDSPNYPWRNVSRATGVSFLRSEVRVVEVSDGLSNTYLIGEKNVCQQNYASLGDDGYDQSLFSGVDLDLSRWSHFPPATDGQTPGVRQFGSAHASVFHMSFCDGSVRSLSYSIDSHTHQFLGNRRDGQKIDTRE